MAIAQTKDARGLARNILGHLDIIGRVEARRAARGTARAEYDAETIRACWRRILETCDTLRAMAVYAERAE